MNEPTKEEERKFWEIVGWKVIDNGRTSLWYSPEKVKRHPRSYASYMSDDPPYIDLNSLFDYAVPKVIAKILESKWNKSHDAYVLLFVWWLAELDITEDPAVALFWACYKVLKK